jgi:hypothetical protein
MKAKIIYLAEYKAKKKREEKYNSLRECLKRDGIELPEPSEWLKKLIDKSFIN